MSQQMLNNSLLAELNQINQKLQQTTQQSAIVTLLKDAFAKAFSEVKQDAVKAFFSPGRVNLIGDHIDYNGGEVFPCALTLGTYAIAQKRNDHRIRFLSLNYPQQGIVEVDLKSLAYDRADGWTNYAKGMLVTLINAGHKINSGLDMVVYGNIPPASGLSSSASIELLTGVVARGLFGLEVDNQTLSLLGKKAENEYIGVNCGIMDQFAIAMGKENQAILLNTETLAYSYAPLNLGEYALIIANTNKKRGLADSKYNERRAECEKALALLQTKANIKQLCELSPQAFEQIKDVLDGTLLRRARHTVNEQHHVTCAMEALKQQDLATFGELMNKSHASLRDDYEVTGIELDTLVAASQAHPACLGARVTGAGFGGCTVALVKREALADFTATVGKTYADKIGYACDFYNVSPGNGAGELTL